MDFFGLVDAIRSYCTENEIFFIYGNQAYSNALADANSYSSNDLILIADFTCIPDIKGGRVVSIIYSGVMSLGRKFETIGEGEEAVDTESSLDETPIQKYDRRLKALSTQLAIIIGELACDNELEITGLNFRFDLNQFDLNADFVATSISFEQ